MRATRILAASIVLVASLGAAIDAGASAREQAARDDFVRLHVTLRDARGAVVADEEVRAFLGDGVPEAVPFLGVVRLPEPLARAALGLGPGEARAVTLAPEDAWPREPLVATVRLLEVVKGPVPVRSGDLVAWEP